MNRPTTLPSDADAVAFVYAEARLLDEKRFDDWFELFTEDARYWMPLSFDQPDGLNHASLFWEDKLLLRVRIERLKSPRAFSQEVQSHCQHVLQQPLVESRDPNTGEVVVRTPFIYVEAQRDTQFVLGATAWHHLVIDDGKPRMRLKRIDLVNRDAALPSIQLFL
ncbi:MAG: aromatic-ring-hydroxylating dioxygenase subunit beta [Burkholderiaceae bacterium]